MSGRTLLSRQLDRRAFLGGVGFTAGAVVASTLVPLSVVHAVAHTDDPAWIGHVDDACGHWPRYAHSIPYGTARGMGDASVHVDMASEPYDHTLMV